jgi:hypothetical protein
MSCTVLLRPSANVLMYLKRAAVARERAQGVRSADEKRFHHQMESRWMNLAASTAFVERVGLFVHSMEGSIVPYDGCPSCHGLMVLETAEIGEEDEVFGFRCRRCGAHQSRWMPPHGVAAVQALAPPPQWDRLWTGK